MTGKGCRGGKVWKCGQIHDAVFRFRSVTSGAVCGICLLLQWQATMWHENDLELMTGGSEKIRGRVSVEKTSLKFGRTPSRSTDLAWLC
jgi:hypothetical protein